MSLPTSCQLVIHKYRQGTAKDHAPQAAGQLAIPSLGGTVCADERAGIFCAEYIPHGDALVGQS